MSVYRTSMKFSHCVSMSKAMSNDASKTLSLTVIFTFLILKQQLLEPESAKHG